MARTNLSRDEHLLVIKENGGIVENIVKAVLAADVPRNELGNVGVELKIAAIRASYA